MSQPDRIHDERLARRLRGVGVVFVIVAIAVVVYGVATRAAQNSSLRDLTEAQAVPIVAVVTPAQVAHQEGLDLPGRLEAYIRAPIYARVPGYVRGWYRDIGAQVKKGEAERLFTFSDSSSGSNNEPPVHRTQTWRIPVRNNPRRRATAA